MHDNDILFYFHSDGDGDEDDNDDILLFFCLI